MREEARRAIEELQIGTKLKHYRTKVRHWTLDELSKKTGLSKPLLSQVENNLVTPPLQTLYGLCKALDVPVIETLKGLDVQPEMDSSASTEAALRQMEVALAELKTAFKGLQRSKKLRKTRASRKRRKLVAKPRKRK
ncbi:MAG: helix-turn-helix transcriptional regulator [Candidatus Brocadiales bacterium]|nr:helix-turn-helix transcriptional regulator [Candidatus Bathyanammoxibius sp.]